MMDLLAIVPYYTAYLSKALLAEGVDLTVGSISYYLDPHCFSSRNIRLDPGLMDIAGKLRLSRMLRRLLKLAEAILNMAALTIRFAISPPDIIHVQFLPMLRWRLPLDSWFVAFCQKRGVKIVLTVHDLLPHDTGNAHQQTFDLLYRRVDSIICHSAHIQTRLESEFSVPEHKITVIPHGPFFYDLPPNDSEPLAQTLVPDGETVLVLWQGIIFPYKGIDLLLQAWQTLEASGANATLVIAGTGAPDLLEQIRMQVQHLDLKRIKLHFHFISTAELTALYRAADIVVYPYRSITTSGALATGLALGKTIVATNLPVFRELLTDRESALLVDPKDPSALAGALVELSANAALRQQLAAKVTEMRFGDQSWLFIAKKTMQVYARVLSVSKSAQAVDASPSF
jgi:glycosyltransferase involved in cell wall biosynthesis